MFTLSLILLSCKDQVILWSNQKVLQLFAAFSFKSQNGYFKEKLLWESSLSQGAAMPGGKVV